MSVTREELYEEVWAEAMTKVAVRYRVSSSFLARVCERMNVPRPPRGYWARVEAGEKISRPVLPDPRPEDALEWTRGREPRRASRALPTPPSRRTAKAAAPVTSRNGVHVLVDGVREHFEAGRETDSYFHAPGYRRPSKKLLVDMFVTKGTLDRALETASKLFLDFEQLGYRVTLAPMHEHFRRPPLDVRVAPRPDGYQGSTWTPARPTIVSIGTVALGLTLCEVSEQAECRYMNGKHVRVADLPPPKRTRHPVSEYTSTREMPGGLLRLRASSPYCGAEWEAAWTEKEPGDLVARATSIARELRRAATTVAELVAEAERAAAIENARWRAQLEKQEREEAERQRVRAAQEAERNRLKNIEDSRRELLAIVEQWALAKRLEAFFDEVQRSAKSHADIDLQAVAARARVAYDLLGGTGALQQFMGWKAPGERP